MLNSSEADSPNEGRRNVGAAPAGGIDDAPCASANEALAKTAAKGAAKRPAVVNKAGFAKVITYHPTDLFLSRCARP